MIFEYLFLLLIGHVLGDFYFQSGKIAKVKDKKYSGVLRHSVEYLCDVSNDITHFQLGNTVGGGSVSIAALGNRYSKILFADK